MSKVLFKLPSCNKQVTTETRWINSNQPRITEMTDVHIENCRMWLHNQIQAEKAVYGCHKERNGFTYPEWTIIFKREEQRRQTIKLETIEIAKVALTAQLNQLEKMAKDTVEYGGKSCNNDDTTDDHAFQARESMMYSYDF